MEQSREIEITQNLQAMADDDSYYTMSGYSIDTTAYPDNTVPFVEMHLNYLKAHPEINPFSYITDLRVMLKI